MRFFGYSNRHLDARIAPSKDSGRYAIAEIAIRDIVDDVEDPEPQTLGELVMDEVD